VALLHQPQLLILDEPTVGVDPLLRQSIWNHLVKLTGDGGEGTTVVITTHYTEEAVQAHRVGMMRNGRLLAEDSPSSLVRSYNQPGLEDVFLHLCQLDGADDKDQTQQTDDANDKLGSMAVKLLPIAEENAAVLSSKSDKNRADDVQEIVVTSDTNDKERLGLLRSVTTTTFELRQSAFSARIVSACMLKTFNRMSKRWGFLIYQFLLPALQVSLFCLAIGQDPKELPVSIVSEEIPFNSSCQQFSTECPVDFGFFAPVSTNKNLGNLSCRYLSYVSDQLIKPVWFASHTQAVEAVERGDTWGVIHMESNFSQALYSKFFESDLIPGSSDANLSTAADIQIELDVTNQQIAFTLQLELSRAFQQFIAQLAESCHVSSEAASIPLRFLEPIYGSHKLTFTDFMAPGIILTIVHSMALGYSAMIIIIERNEGLLDRTWVAGVSPGEFSLAHFLCSISVNTVQVVLTLAFMIGVFKVPVEGSYILVFLLTLLQGMCGITIGLIISSVCKTQQDATQIALGIFYPNMLLSGILWPLEAMPVALRYIAYTLPQTCACEAMRAILLRGWDLYHPLVARGFLITLAWITATYLIFKIKISRST